MVMGTMKDVRAPSVLAVIALSIGVAVRLRDFMFARSLWLDEAMLALNVASRSFAELARPLDYTQVAPILFLWLQKACVAVAGVNEPALRLVPMVAGLALPVLGWRLARVLFGDWAGAAAAAASRRLAHARPVLERGEAIRRGRIRHDRRDRRGVGGAGRFIAHAYRHPRPRGRRRGVGVFSCALRVRQRRSLGPPCGRTKADRALALPRLLLGHGGGCGVRRHLCSDRGEDVPAPGLRVCVARAGYADERSGALGLARDGAARVPRQRIRHSRRKRWVRCPDHLGQPGRSGHRRPPPRPGGRGAARRTLRASPRRVGPAALSGGRAADDGVRRALAHPARRGGGREARRCHPRSPRPHAGPRLLSLDRGRPARLAGDRGTRAVPG